MDTSDPDIQFDAGGVCNHCHHYEQTISSEIYQRARQHGSLDELVNIIKSDGKGRRYDCVIGVSGGVDSSYTALLTRQLGLRPLAVHLDNGWDSELAVSNIEVILKKLNIDLYTHVLDWNEFRDLQLSFLKSSTPDSEIPTDHAIHAILYHMAAVNNVRYVLIGRNTATECGGVPAWSQGHGDWRYINSIHKRFGSHPLKSYMHYGLPELIYYSLAKRIQWISILDYIDYRKSEAQDVLEQQLGWRPYGGKHYESIYTRFYQGYILPQKFGFDKRRLHLSALVWSGQITRQQALEQIRVIDYPKELQEQDREYVIKKLSITEKEFDLMMATPVKTFWDYPSYKKLIGGNSHLLHIYRSIKR